MIISIYKSCEGHQALQRVGAVDSSDFLHDREAGRMSNQVDYRGVGAMDSSPWMFTITKSQSFEDHTTV